MVCDGELRMNCIHTLWFRFSISEIILVPSKLGVTCESLNWCKVEAYYIVVGWRS
jgi:hypothetical protein